MTADDVERSEAVAAMAKQSTSLDQRQPCQPEPGEEGQTLLDAMLQEYDAIKDVSDPEAELGSIVRHRVRLATELERLKANMAAMVHQAEQQLARCDQMHRQRAEELTRGLLKGKARSVKTAYGVAGFRSKAKSIEVVEPDKVPATFLRIEPKIDKLAINKAFKEEGLIPEGCEVIPAHDDFYIR